MDEKTLIEFATAVKDECIDDNGIMDMLEAVDLVSAYSLATISAICGGCNVNKDQYVMILDGLNSINKARSEIAIEHYENKKANVKKVTDSINDLMKRILN